MGNSASGHSFPKSGKTAVPSVLVVVGPSGVGKGTLINRLRDGNDSFDFSCSHTTRPPRDGETVGDEHENPDLSLPSIPDFYTQSFEDGTHYYFVTREEFEKGISDGKFLEYASVHGNFYGTSIDAVKKIAEMGKCCIMDIDVQGARQVRSSGIPAIFVFVAPPSLEALEERLRSRGTETDEQIQTRLHNAKTEIESIQEAELYDFIIVNNDLEECTQQLKSIAARALAGEVGPVLGSNTEASGNYGGIDASLQEPPSAALSLRGWLTDERSPAIGAGSRTHQLVGVSPSQLANASTVARAPFAGSIAIVTGVGGPIGWATTLGLISLGIRVAAVSKEKSRLEALQKAASSETSAELLPVVCDLAKESEVEALMKIINRQWPDGCISVLINAAAVESWNAGGTTFLEKSMTTDLSSLSSTTENGILGRFFGYNVSNKEERSVRSAESSEENPNHTKERIINRSRDRKPSHVPHYVTEGTSSIWEDVVRSGLLGSANITRYVLQQMKQGPVIHSNSSVSGPASNCPGHIITILPNDLKTAADNDFSNISEGSTSMHRLNAFHGIHAVVCEAVREFARQIHLETAHTGIRTSCIKLDISKRLEGTVRADGLGETAATAVWCCLAAPSSVDVTELVASVPINVL